MGRPRGKTAVLQREAEFSTIDLAADNVGCMPVTPRGLTRVSAGLSGLFAVALGMAAVASQSELAFAQAADSLLDFSGALLLAWVVHIAQTPGDERHPMGHARAEPLGALAVAALAGILALEVGTRAVNSLLGEPEVVMTWVLLWLFLGKMLFKAVILHLAQRTQGPACAALAVDARNDLLVSGVALFGFFGARAGATWLDAALALPASLWIAWSGFILARENIDILLGVAPPQERKAELLALAASVKGILDAPDLVGHSMGTGYSIHVNVTVDENLTVRQAHELGEGVRERLMQEPDVSHCSVHLDPSGE